MKYGDTVIVNSGPYEGLIGEIKRYEKKPGNTYKSEKKRLYQVLLQGKGEKFSQRFTPEELYPYDEDTNRGGIIDIASVAVALTSIKDKVVYG